jgi:hypothetical protein
MLPHKKRQAMVLCIHPQTVAGLSYHTLSLTLDNNAHFVRFAQYDSKSQVPKNHPVAKAVTYQQDISIHVFVPKVQIVG